MVTLRDLLHRLRRRRPTLSHREQLTRLLSVLDKAAALAPTAEDAVRACGADGDIPGEVGATCGELVTAYQRIRTELHAFPITDPVTTVVDEVERLLHYHQWLLRTALQLAFSINPDPRREAMRRRLAGVGAPATRLNTVRATRDSPARRRWQSR